MSRSRDNRIKSHQGNPYNILPPTDILESYESTSPGSVKKLLEMATKEQEHRHAWQEEHLRVHGKIHKWGQIFAFSYNILLLLLVGYLIEGENHQLALQLFTINAFLMAFAILVTFIERRIMNRRPPRRFPNNQQINNKKNTNHSKRR